MKVGDLVSTRWKKDAIGIIVGDGSLSWQRGNQMWAVQFPDGKRVVCHEHQLEVISESR